MKLIFFYRFNIHKELVFYGKLNKKLSDYQILAIVQNVIVKVYEKKEKDMDELSRTLSSDIIKDVTVIIESLTIEQIINLNNHLIIDSLGRIPEEDIDILDNDQTL
ncbi:3082_t:CDS:1 [Ambispora leptoticha]|uniref:3082_t:CDS:1 n=1 Tax=Ambispora leptoticha TaxID=144679 RepID=A0A9N9N2L2_9GLOM|nr:3082_t:CDS:1 [Ambispora leptoticha]